MVTVSCHPIFRAAPRDFIAEASSVEIRSVLIITGSGTDLRVFDSDIAVSGEGKIASGVIFDEGARLGLVYSLARSLVRRAAAGCAEDYGLHSRGGRALLHAFLRLRGLAR